MSSTVNVRIREAWQSLHSVRKVLEVGLLVELSDDNGLNKVGSDLWHKVSGQTLLLSGLWITLLEVGSEAFGYGEWSVWNTTSSGTARKTEWVLLGSGIDIWSVSSHTGDTVEDWPLFHWETAFDVEHPIPVWLSTSVRALIAESLLILVEHISVPVEEETLNYV